MKNSRIIIIFLLLAVCFCDHCNVEVWTDLLCDQCQDRPFANLVGKGCSIVDCKKNTLWTNETCKQCWSPETKYGNNAQTKCVEIDCINYSRFDDSSCNICYGNNTYPSLDGKYCVPSTNCNSMSDQKQLTQELCQICDRKNPNVNLDKSGCVNIHCDVTNPYSTESCNSCYKRYLYPMLNNVGCTDTHCDLFKNEYTDQICTECLGQPAFATSNSKQCKLLPSLSNFRKISS